MKRRTIALIVPLVLALTAACGGGESSADIGQAGPIGRGPNEPPAAAAPIVGNFPLTGMPAIDAAKLRRPAVAVKIDNNVQARPQAGLEAADVIYEEFTEGITRFVVVFQSADAGVVGPVRSVRPGDPSIVRPFGGPLVFSGGSAPVLAVVRAAGIRQVTENDRDTLRRRSGKRAPHNLYTDTASMYRKAGAGTAPPAFSTFLAPGAPPAAAGATPAAAGGWVCSLSAVRRPQLHRPVPVGLRRRSVEAVDRRPAAHARGGSPALSPERHRAVHAVRQLPGRPEGALPRGGRLG
jgi:hypothetical protein